MILNWRRDNQQLKDSEKVKLLVWSKPVSWPLKNNLLKNQIPWSQYTIKLIHTITLSLDSKTQYIYLKKTKRHQIKRKKDLMWFLNWYTLRVGIIIWLKSEIIWLVNLKTVITYKKKLIHGWFIQVKWNLQLMSLNLSMRCLNRGKKFNRSWRNREIRMNKIKKLLQINWN